MRLPSKCEENDLKEIEGDLLDARNQLERLMIFHLNHFQSIFMNKQREEKSSSTDSSEKKSNNIQREDNIITQLIENQRDLSFHYGYLLKYLVSTHYLKKRFIEELKEKSFVFFFQLWEEVDDLFNSMMNDIFITQKDVFLSFQRIKQNFKNILYYFLNLIFFFDL